MSHHKVAARRRASAARSSTPTYPPGYFTELVRKHDFPPRFESQITGLISSKTKRFASEYELNERRRNGGFDKFALGLPGAVKFVVSWEAHKARAA